MRLARKHRSAASSAVVRNVLTMIVCIGVGGVLFALKPGLASSIREIIHLPRTVPFSNTGQLTKTAETEQQPQQVASDIDLSQKPEEEQVMAFTMYSSKFFIAQYCSDNEAFFTSDDVERLKSKYQKIFSTMTLSQEKKDDIWQKIQAVGPTQLAGMTAQECAAEKQSYLFTWPDVFAPSNPVENPF